MYLSTAGLLNLSQLHGHRQVVIHGAPGAEVMVRFYTPFTSNIDNTLTEAIQL